MSYPRISPAVIMAVTRGEKILLARSRRFPTGFYSVLAGFVEPGETLEQCVQREVREETGMEVKNLRYFASQPWPFPHSLMIAFTAEHAAGKSGSTRPSSWMSAGTRRGASQHPRSRSPWRGGSSTGSPPRAAGGRVKVALPVGGRQPPVRGLSRYRVGDAGHDDLRHFEFLVLEAAQAGLSWLTILRKRDAYRAAYRGFDPVRVARFSSRDVERLLGDAGIVRNRAKIASSINNARRFLEVQKEFGSFDAYLWSWTGGKPVLNRWKEQSEIPPRSELSDAVAKDLKARGFSFVGSTILYSHLQAVGVVNDHLLSCFRGRELRGLRIVESSPFLSAVTFPVDERAHRRCRGRRRYPRSGLRRA